MKSLIGYLTEGKDSKTISFSEFFNDYFDSSEKEIMKNLKKDGIDGIEINMEDFEMVKKKKKIGWDNREYVRMDSYGHKFRTPPFMSYQLKNKKVNATLVFYSYHAYENTITIICKVKLSQPGAKGKYLTDMIWMDAMHKTSPFDRAEALFDFLDGKTSTYTIEIIA